VISTIANMNAKFDTTLGCSAGVAGERGFLALLRIAALIAVPAGAMGSVGLTLYAGHRNNSVLLLGLFTIWVLSPFIALALANEISKRLSNVSRATLHSVMVVIALVSLVIYGAVALGPPRPRTAFVFVVVPPASWLLIAVVVSLIALLERRKP
jgi:hypothetical protein